MKSSVRFSLPVVVATSASVAAVIIGGDYQVWGWTSTANLNVSPLTAAATMGRSAIGNTINPASPAAFSTSTGQLPRISTILSSSVVADNEQTSASSSSSSPEQTKNSNKSYLDDGFIFGLDGSGLERPIGKQAQVVVEGDSLETTTMQRAIVWTTLCGNAFFALQALQHMLVQNSGNIVETALQAILLGLSSWVLADFGSGVLHWSVDNYGNGRTPIIGGIIAAFQGHHSAPWTITERGFENNVYKLCAPFGILTVGLISLLFNPSTAWFMSIFCTLEILSQEFHKWSHTTKTQVPSWVNKLQGWSVTIGRAPHAQHHIAPYDGNYCIVSGVCNDVLDKYGAFRRLEHWVYKWNGVESNAWKLDPQLKQRTLNGDYMLPSPSSTRTK